MAMQLDRIVPFGRSLDEYRRMFALSKDDLRRRILGVGDGPASFNAELTGLGGRAVSVDPLYIHTAQEIEMQFNKVVDGIIAQVAASRDDWAWSYHKSPEGLREHRAATARRFAADFTSGRKDGRYVVGGVPELPFRDGTFDLALCSHFLFLYSDQLGLDFHLASIREILRVAGEARFFPLLTLGCVRSPHVEPAIEALRADGYTAEIERVDYEFQKGGNEMLRLGNGEKV